ncbi:glycosyltransferase [Qipengyuania sp. 6B39]|uniref:glycosyltransferase family 4 protein n=1 Tax=Qipengyuania proteolytica TaxID=2867239 RepID=UPI001C89CDF1|nr:glycosyltransferase family 4 protein [Qipengyuania proteolytica]MBX7496413.1 glycosyltransferase [Qipengyuania proteolytica]
MKLLYAFQNPRSATSGLSIYDRRLSQALEGLGHEIQRVALEESAPSSGYAGILRGMPPAIARYRSRANASLVAQAIAQFDPDRVILSHESTLYLVEQGIVPRSRAIILCHNIMAPGYRSRGTIADRIYAELFHRYERRLTRASVPVTAISEYDRQAAEDCYGLTMAAACPPGVIPGCSEIEADAQFAATVAISGNYDWRLKRQDISRFFDEAIAVNLPGSSSIYLSEGAAKHAPEALDHTVGLPARGSLGIGLVVDRFQAGFKLKALEYISEGMVLVSYCDLSGEFAGLANAQMFVHRVAHASEVPGIIEDLQRTPDLVERYRAFQRAAFERFQWAESARRVMEVLED